MKRFRIVFLLAVIAIIAGAFVAGCGSDQPPAQTQTAKPSASATPAAATGDNTDSYQTRIKFKAADGSDALVIKRYSDHDKLEINFAGSNAVIKARSNAENRWKYKEAADGADEKVQIAEVKLQQDSFKLVDTDEKLLWKVRIKDGKIKVSDNEDGDNSWEIKSKSADKSEIRNQAGEEIGNVKYYNDNGKLKVKNSSNNEILVSKDIKASAAPGVILFDHIPLKHRMVIISELLRMGQ
ncbi:MAG: hypothetical protein CVV41_15755 [Candidatus Riflebacteria bacterium HGW-Riflebacteria-1]|jgi:hypothetical protein|nr:MAG: hypothetical protein CVV41_15755 [Candidatus Riflebacteria bacterium HGW-Riflebacteria-1]